MSDYSRAVRQRFLSQLALAAESMEQPDDQGEPILRLRGRGAPVPGPEVMTLFCPLTAACFHVNDALFAIQDYRYAAEELALPRGMGEAIAQAADGAGVTAWRWDALTWWRRQLLAALGVPREEPDAP